MSELVQSRDELEVARQLLDRQHPRHAVSRAYYAAFYAARAALKTIGVAPKTHSGLRSKFADLARSTPALGPELGTTLADLAKQRGDADYGEDTDTGADEARRAIADAEVLVNAVERFLESAPGDAPPK